MDWGSNPECYASCSRITSVNIEPICRSGNTKTLLIIDKVNLEKARIKSLGADSVIITHKEDTESLAVCG